jgi:hypothetical protein
MFWSLISLTLGKKILLLSRQLPHFIEPQSLGKAVKCNMNVNTADWGGDFTVSPTIRATTLILA